MPKIKVKQFKQRVPTPNGHTRSHTDKQTDTHTDSTKCIRPISPARRSIKNLTYSEMSLVTRLMYKITYKTAPECEIKGKNCIKCQLHVNINVAFGPTFGPHVTTLKQSRNSSRYPNMFVNSSELSTTA